MRDVLSLVGPGGITAIIGAALLWIGKPYVVRAIRRYRLGRELASYGLAGRKRR